MTTCRFHTQWISEYFHCEECGNLKTTYGVTMVMYPGSDTKGVCSMCWYQVHRRLCGCDAWDEEEQRLVATALRKMEG